MTTKILELFASYLKNGSGWTLKNVIGLNITYSRLRPLRGSSHIPLPEKILRKKALINMENEDDECFKWAVTRALNLVGKDSQRVTKELREQSEKLIFDGIEFPTPCSERMFKKFENNNDVSVLVFGYENKDIIPLYVPIERRERIVRLFFYKNEDGTKSHYCVIKSMSRLVSSQISKKKAKKFICDFCLNAFGNEDLLNEHVKYCSKHDAVNVVMPNPKNNFLKFKSIQNLIECPVKIYADFESFLKTICEMRGETKLYQKHVPSAFSIYVVSRVEGFSMEPITYACQSENEQVGKIFV